MRIRTSIFAIVATALLGALPMERAFGQDSTAGQEMHKGGEAVENAGSAAGKSVEHVYHASVDQMSDAALTTKVKSALWRNERTRKYSIHVESDQGKVTIDGAVRSRKSAKYVQAVVAAVEGVHKVDNKLTWPSS